MTGFIAPKSYQSILNVRETEEAIKALRLFFEEELASALNLSRASAPLFLLPESGLNDNLNEVERPVEFDILEQSGVVCEIVQSLAKWKRFALGRYHFQPGEGLYTNMNAIRRDEYTDNLHSLYVDQWDWEKVITKSQRTLETLKVTVEKIYGALKKTELFVCEKYPQIKPFLPEKITFVTTQELENQYPALTPSEREIVYSKEHGAIFVMQIGAKLASGAIHDGRAADYDDWSMNGDIVIYYPVLDRAFEISSMGVRVDEEALTKQLEERGRSDKLKMPFQRAILEGDLPYTIGGGIGQSRLCMLMLHKAHIGEVQVSVWPAEMELACKEAGIQLL